MKAILTPAVRTSRLAIVDSLASCRIGISDHLKACGGFCIAWTSATAEEAYGKLSADSPDLLILEIQLTGQDGLEFIKNIRPLYPQLKILVHSSLREEFYATRCLRAGAMGFFHKARPMGKLFPAIRKILDGGIYLSENAMTRTISDLLQRPMVRDASGPGWHLTDRELEVITLMASGDSCKQTADKLRISPRTVQVHRTNIRQKLRLDSASRLHAYAVRFFSESAQSSEALVPGEENRIPKIPSAHRGKRRNGTRRSSPLPRVVGKAPSHPKAHPRRSR